jgi:acetyl-CoA carboxylase carboxyltransferase component
MEALGGWELHAKITAQIDRVAENEDEALASIRSFLGYLPSNSAEAPPRVDLGDDPRRRSEELLSIVPTDPKRAYDVHRVLRQIVDKGQYLELKPDYGRQLVTALARLDGQTVGFFANNPMYGAAAMETAACEKAMTFTALCDTYSIPLIFLHDNPGFLIGGSVERGRGVSKIMVWLEAVALATVPKISVVLRKSFGQAYFNMVGGGGFGADFLFAWPCAEISFTSPEAGIPVVHRKELEAAPDRAALMNKLTAEWRAEMAPWKAAKLGYLDDIIDPRDTRVVLIQALRYSSTAPGYVPPERRADKRLAPWPTKV